MTHPRLAAIHERVEQRLRDLIAQYPHLEAPGDSNSLDRAWRREDLYNEEVERHLTELEAAAVEARTYGRHVTSQTDFDEIRSAINADDDYRAVWDRWWAPLFAAQRDEVDDDGKLRYRPDPAVAAAVGLLEQAQADGEQFDFSEVLDALAGAVDMDQVQRELADYATLLDSVSTVFMHVTSGRISKPFTLPSSVCAVADEIIDERLEKVRKAAEPFLEERAMVIEAGAAPVAIDGRLLLQLLDAIEAL